ncbi:redoxin domain-containing protein [archaeon]|nr:redoxin domain-containing protein [archaeon]
MNKNIIIVGLFIALLGLAACATGVKDIQETNNVDVTNTANSGVVETSEPELIAGTTTKLYEFDQISYEKALSEGKTVILNFYATWCPSCKAEQPVIIDVFNEHDDPNLVAFRVNWKDPGTSVDEENLAKEFGITVQGTKIFLKGGEKVLKAPEHWPKDRWVTELEKLK